MPADLNQLVPALKERAGELLAVCQARGAIMRPYCTLRSPFDQARLWRQTRSSEEVQAQQAEFRQAGAEFLAFCLESVGPQQGAGPHVTKALPGFSWHQWGEALDCFWLVDGQAVWSTTSLREGINGYRIYAEAAEDLGLAAGGLWPRFKDWPHVQLRPEGPARYYSLEQIDQEMKTRFV